MILNVEHEAEDVVPPELKAKTCAGNMETTPLVVLPPLGAETRVQTAGSA